MQKKRKIYRSGPGGRKIQVKRVEDQLIDDKAMLDIKDIGWMSKQEAEKPTRRFYYVEPDLNHPDAKGHEGDVIELETERSDDKADIERRGHSIYLQRMVNTVDNDELWDRYGIRPIEKDQLDDINHVLGQERLEDTTDAIRDLKPGSADTLGNIVGRLMQLKDPLLSRGELSSRNRTFRQLYRSVLQRLGKELKVGKGIPDEIKGAFVVNRRELFSNTTESSQELDELAEQYKAEYQKSGDPLDMRSALKTRISQARAYIEEGLEDRSVSTSRITEGTRELLAKVMQYPKVGIIHNHMLGIMLLKNNPARLVELLKQLTNEVKNVVKREKIPQHVVDASIRNRNFLSKIRVGQDASKGNLDEWLLYSADKPPGVDWSVISANKEQVSEIFSVYL